MESPRHFFTDAGFSCFGSGLPTAAAIKLWDPGARVFLLAGDGGFHSGSGEIETLVRHGIGIVGLIINSSSLGLIDLHQRQTGRNAAMLSFGDVDFAALARANGAQGVRCSSEEEMHEAIKAHVSSQPLFVDIPAAYDDDELGPNFESPISQTP